MHNKMGEIPVSDRLDDVVQGTLKQLKRQQKQKKIRNRIVKAGSAAAAVVVVCGVLAANPVLAEKIPLIGRIFSNVENSTDYKGKLNENATALISAEDAEKAEQGEATENAYIQTSNGITMTVSEVYYNNKAMYFAVALEKEDAFPNELCWVKNMQDYILQYDQMQIIGTAAIDGVSDWGIPAPTQIQGLYSEDMKTFSGIIRVDLTNYGQTLPDAFQYSLDISQLFGEKVTAAADQSEEENLDRYDGTWNFTFDVKPDTSKNQVVEINDANEAGVGISQIEKTPYEITAGMLLPDGMDVTDTILVMCDANGDLLDSQGDNAEVYSTYGRDLSTVYVYVCDYVEYMDELKGYYWSEDYETKKAEMNFAQYLQEHALYGTQAHFQD